MVGICWNSNVDVVLIERNQFKTYQGCQQCGWVLWVYTLANMGNRCATHGQHMGETQLGKRGDVVHWMATSKCRGPSICIAQEVNYVFGIVDPLISVQFDWWHLLTQALWSPWGYVLATSDGYGAFCFPHTRLDSKPSAAAERRIAWISCPFTAP